MLCCEEMIECPLILADRVHYHCVPTLKCIVLLIKMCKVARQLLSN